MRGKKIRTMYDPSLAKPHAAGSEVRILLPTLHCRYGVVNFEKPRYWPSHLAAWQGAHAKLIQHDAELLQLPVGPPNQRIVPPTRGADSTSLRDDIYATGVELVLSVVLTLEHLVLEIESTARIPPRPRAELTERYANALRGAGLGDPTNDPSWNDIVLLHKYRDAVMHPSSDNTYGSDDGSWARVPLAWFGSGKAIESSRRALDSVLSIARQWEVKKNEYAHPATLTVTRGIRSTEPTKKPKA